MRRAKRGGERHGFEQRAALEADGALDQVDALNRLVQLVGERVAYFFAQAEPGEDLANAVPTPPLLEGQLFSGGNLVARRW